jgi:hypothetical protein
MENNMLNLGMCIGLFVGNFVFNYILYKSITRSLIVGLLAAIIYLVLVLIFIINKFKNILIFKKHNKMCINCGYLYGKHKADTFDCPDKVDEHGWHHGWKETKFRD